MNNPARIAPWIICPFCLGEGGHTRTYRDERGCLEEDEYGEPVSHHEPCRGCDGLGKLRQDAVPLVRYGPDGEAYYYADADDASEHHLRMMGG